MDCYGDIFLRTFNSGKSDYTHKSEENQGKILNMVLNWHDGTSAKSAKIKQTSKYKISQYLWQLFSDFKQWDFTPCKNQYNYTIVYQIIRIQSTGESRYN